ncbi:hypothetical protein CONLIGDRAFT_636120 [Coniochaeta ligniaria NRRL 30616]|uniref:Uncharacterized protein n=1 Tax=Coniochaeta ligniaria NRRL 30616 TaxID=1408157 RepID=A0A1J7IC22_9PEZI|nr:hypothetical protein CONLIGDRAFT_636120 [Coniochaeta ligniaria NRRL 30616]
MGIFGRSKSHRGDATKQNRQGLGILGKLSRSLSHRGDTAKQTRQEQQTSGNELTQQQTLPDQDYDPYETLPDQDNDSDDESASPAGPKSGWYMAIQDVHERKSHIELLIANLEKELQAERRKFEDHEAHRENIRVFDWRQNDKTLKAVIANLEKQLKDALEALEGAKTEYGDWLRKKDQGLF